MRSTLSFLGIAALALTGCQPEGYVDPVDNVTGHPPRAQGVIYTFDAARSAPFLDANLRASNAVSGTFASDGTVIAPLRVDGAFPAQVGADANLREGVGFGTYANPDYRGAGVTWAEADPFRSVLTATLDLGDEGNGVTFCRSFATTCVTLLADPLGLGANVAVVTLAANAPDTDIGEISAGVSAAIRGTGANGLSIALADPSVVALAFLPSGEITLDWTVERGAAPGSLDWSVAINGAELGSGNTATDLAAAIVKERGVALVFDTPLGASTSTWLHTSYTFDGQAAYWFEAPLGFGVDLSPLPRLGHAPLYVYATNDSQWAVGTDSGNEGAAHAVQLQDGIVGAVTQAGGAAGQHIVWSTRFDGDDFEDTPYEGLVDQGIEGGGFYPSPSFCYAQVLPQLQATVAAGVRAEVHRVLYASVANAAAGFDAPLVSIVSGLNTNFGTTLTFTPLGSAAAYIALGTEYADGNVDAMITTSAEASFTPTLTETTSQTYAGQLLAIFGALNVTVEGTPRWQLLGMQAGQYAQFAGLTGLLNFPRGVQDGVFDGTTAHLDVWPPFGIATCQGTDCRTAWIVDDIARGTNTSDRNPSEGVPGLAATCQWGRPGVPAVDAVDATLTGDLNEDHPAYAAVAATAPVVPVREQASPSINTLVMGIYGNFITAAFGPTVPASNFSMSMTIDAEATTPPTLSTLQIAVE